MAAKAKAPAKAPAKVAASRRSSETAKLGAIAEELQALRQTLKPPQRQLDAEEEQRVEHSKKVASALRSSLVVVDRFIPAVSARWNGTTLTVKRGKEPVEGLWLHAVLTDGTELSGRADGSGAISVSAKSDMPIMRLEVFEKQLGARVAVASFVPKS